MTNTTAQQKQELLDQATAEAVDNVMIVADQDGDTTPFLSRKAVKEDPNLRNYLDVNVIKGGSTYKVRVLKADPFQLMILFRDSNLMKMEQYSDMTEEDFTGLPVETRIDITLSNRDYSDRLIKQFIQLPDEDGTFKPLPDVLPLHELDEDLRDLVIQAYYKVNPGVSTKSEDETEVDRFRKTDPAKV